MSFTTANYFETGVIDSEDRAREVAWFINGAHPTASPQNTVVYKAIDSWDGTLREQPTDGLMVNLTGSNKWKPDPSPASQLPQGSFVIFESIGGGVAAKFNLVLNIGSSGQPSWSLAPLGDWVPGGGTGAAPTVPSTMMGHFNFAILNGVDNRHGTGSTLFMAALIDEGTVIINSAPATGMAPAVHSTYIGEVKSITTEANHPRPFVITTLSTTIGFAISVDYRMVSPLDDSTICTVKVYPRQFPVIDSATPYNDLGDEYVFSVDIYSFTASHRFPIGTLRNVGAISELTPANRATAGITASDFRFVVISPENATPAMVMLWPPGTALADGHTVISEESIPAELKPPATPDDFTRPIVTFVDPVQGHRVSRLQTVTIDVTDETGIFNHIGVTVKYEESLPRVPEEVVWTGSRFGDFYETSTKAPIANGFRFVLDRRNPNLNADPLSDGWQAQPSFEAKVVDGGGNTSI